MIISETSFMRVEKMFLVGKRVGGSPVPKT
jgi:hypothetical protein